MNIVPKRVFSNAATTCPKVFFEQHSLSVAEWKLNVPKALNSLDHEMCNMMIEELKRWKKTDAQPRVLLMSGMGERAFCSGGNIVDLYNAHTIPGADKSILVEFFAREYLLDYTLS